MTTEIPRELEKHLLKIAKHEGELNYIKRNLESIPFSQAWEEIVLFEGLKDNDLIYLQGESINLADIDNSGRIISFKPTFFLTADAKIYLKNLSKNKWKRFAQAAGKTIALIASVLVIVDFILTYCLSN